MSERAKGKCGGVYPDEVDEICGKLTEASGMFGNILERLSKIK